MTINLDEINKALEKHNRYRFFRLSSDDHSSSFGQLTHVFADLLTNGKVVITNYTDRDTLFPNHEDGKTPEITDIILEWLTKECSRTQCIRRIRKKMKEFYSDNPITIYTSLPHFNPIDEKEPIQSIETTSDGTYYLVSKIPISEDDAQRWIESRI